MHAVPIRWHKTKSDKKNFQWKSYIFTQNSFLKFILSSLINEILKASCIRLIIFLYMLFKYLFIKNCEEYSHNDPLKGGKNFGKKRK